MGPPWQFALNKTPPARPNLGFTICHLSLFPLGFRKPEGHLYFKPPGQCSSECWSKLEPFAAPPWGNSMIGFSCTDCSSGVPWERDMCSSYRDLSAHSGGFAGLVLPLSRCLVNRDSETDRVFPGEGISFIDRESLWWAKLGHPCRV